MPASIPLLTSAAALLLLGLALHWPAALRSLGRRGFAALALGMVLPLLDPLTYALVSEDQIALLAQPPVFAGPLPGFGLIALAGAAYALALRRAPPWALLGLSAAGLLVPLCLAMLTPVGTPWLAPFSASRWAWPVFPAGHPVLVLLTAILLAALEAWPRQGRRLAALALALLGLYTGAGVSGRVWAGQERSRITFQFEKPVVEPAGWAPWEWLVAGEDAQSFQALSAGGTPVIYAQCNDQPVLLRLLEDPVVRSYYYSVFRHPVAKVEHQGALILLTLQELAHVSRGDAGPTFTFSTDWAGRSRVYNVSRFD